MDVVGSGELALLDAEFDRLLSLRSYDVLDTPPEPGFDGLTELAAFVCEAPVALVSLVDAERQWFKSRRGVEVCETPRSESFCAYALASTEIMEVADTWLDGRFAQHPAVLGAPHYRFYAGAPLITSDGHALGTLCVLDFQPRTLTSRQRTHLRILADQVMGQLEVRRSAKQFAAEVEARFEADAALREQQRMLEGVLNHTDVLIYAKDVQGRFLMVNPALEKVTEGGLIGRTDHDLFTHEVAEGYRRNDRHIMASREWQVFSEDLVHPDGSTHTYRSTKFPLIDDRGEVIGLAGVSTDVTELASARAAHAESEKRWRALVDQLPAAVLTIDAGGSVTYANAEACILLGAASGSQVEGLPAMAFIPDDLQPMTQSLIDSVLADGLELRSHRGGIRRLDGVGLAVEFSACRVTHDGAASVQIEFRDVTAVEAVHAALKHSASTDALTGLLNRQAWDAQVEALFTDPRYRGTPVTVAVIDIDHFKKFNDTRGHTAGDALLQHFAAAAGASLRKDDVLARWGGEEFVVALPNTAPEHAENVLQRIRGCMPLGQTCSVGYTAHLPIEPLLDTVIRADRALYRAKTAGRDQVWRL